MGLCCVTSPARQWLSEAVGTVLTKNLSVMVKYPKETWIGGWELLKPWASAHLSGRLSSCLLPRRAVPSQAGPGPRRWPRTARGYVGNFCKGLTGGYGRTIGHGGEMTLLLLPVFQTFPHLPTTAARASLLWPVSPRPDPSAASGATSAS